MRIYQAVVKEIIQRYYETIDLQKSIPKIEIVIHETYDSIPKYTHDNISQWAIAFNQSLNEESRTNSHFKLHLPDYDLILVVNQSAF